MQSRYTVQRMKFTPYRIYAVRVYGAESEIYTVQNLCSQGVRCREWNSHRIESMQSRYTVQRVKFTPYRIYAVRVYGAENEIYTVQNPCIPPASAEVHAGGANQNFTLRSEFYAKII